MNYNNWEKQVQHSLEKLKTKLDQNSISKELYNGFYIWDSKYRSNPEIMFIGINPGDGNPNNDKSIVVKPEKQMSYLEYWDEDEPNLTYTLARETINVFQKLGYNQIQITDIFNNKSVKTNFYYVITKKENDIKKAFNTIENKGFNEYWVKSYKWTGELIDILKPKIIICEGKGVFDMIKDYDDNINVEWNSDCGFIERKDGIIVIGYSRIFSNIKNKTGVADLISKFWKYEK